MDFLCEKVEKFITRKGCEIFSNADTEKKTYWRSYKISRDKD